MRPSEEEVAAQGGTAERTPSALVRLQPLRRRADFMRAARARRQGTKGFLLQARRRSGDEDDPRTIRVGFTCSRKLGNAVVRNRAKRRLREAARAILPAQGRPGWDYVLVGRPGATVERDFRLLLEDLRYALDSVHSRRAGNGEGQ